MTSLYSYRRVDGSRHARILRRRLIEFEVPGDLKPVGAPEKLRVYLDRIYERVADDFFENTTEWRNDGSVAGARSWITSSR